MSIVTSMSIQNAHPIVYDSFTICELVHLGVRQENFIICLFDVFSQVIGPNSVCLNSRKVTFSTAELIFVLY